MQEKKTGGHMKLSDYFKENGVSKRWFSKKTGISSRTIYNICQGKKANPWISKTVEIFTYGHVKAKDICCNVSKLPLLEQTMDIIKDKEFKG